MTQEDIRYERRRLRDEIARLEEEIDRAEGDVKDLQKTCAHPDPLPIGGVGFHCRDCGRLWHKDDEA